MADEHDTGDIDLQDAEAIRTVHGGEPLAWPLRLAMYVIVAVIWYGVYSAWWITEEILFDSPIPVRLLFVSIVVAYQFLLELSLRRWPKKSQSNTIALLMPGVGATGFLITFIQLESVMYGSQMGGPQMSFGIGELLYVLLLGIPAYYVTTAPVTIPGALATAWLVRRYAPVPPKPPAEDFDAY